MQIKSLDLSEVIENFSLRKYLMLLGEEYNK